GVLDGLSVATDGESGAVTLGGYPLYPELKFALTNKNTTRVTDLSSSAPLSIASVSLQNHVHQVVSVSAADAAAIVGAAASGSAATTAMTTGTPK
ncbi:MAG: hypothetical protein IKY83_08060, partial [Proteobacteria bacterium]|nr:hypothetical protein [Pseudomonadota bacterium]